MVDNKIGKIINLILCLASLLGLIFQGIRLVQDPSFWSLILYLVLVLAWLRYAVFLYRKYIYHFY